VIFASIKLFGIHSIWYEKDKWLEFIQKAINFTVSVYGEDAFYSDEPQPAPSPTQQVSSIAHVKNVEK
jgi:hypothetical protein